MEETKTTERWVPAKYIRENGTILDFTGLYEVSDLGRVRSLNYRCTGKAKELKLVAHKCNDVAIMYNVGLCKNTIQYVLKVHRLVLSSFNPEGFRPGRIVNHKIERTSASCINELSNLEWSTPKDNTSTEHCKALKSRAHINHPSLSKRVRVTDISTSNVTEYLSVNEVCRVLGVSPGTVCTCIYKFNGYYKKRNLHFEYIK